MKIVLLKDIPNFGQTGDIKEVSDGYGRNFLLARKLGVLATKQALTEAAKIQEQKRLQAEEELKTTEVLVKKLDGREFTIKAKAKDGKLFGGIGPEEISQAAAKVGFDIAPTTIKLAKHIKELGEYELELHLPHNLEAKIKVIIKEE